MSCYLFDGKEFAKRKEALILKKVVSLKKNGLQPRIKSFVFTQDKGSVLYTKLKQACAKRLEIEYEAIECELSDKIELISEKIRQASEDELVTGVMIQKPAQSTWLELFPDSTKEEFAQWWRMLVLSIDPKKDVDCLHPENLSAILHAQSSFFPATVLACLSILNEAKKVLHVSDGVWRTKKVVVIGRSDIVGRPLASALHYHFNEVTNLGRTSDQGKDVKLSLEEFDIVISAVGKSKLVTGEQLKDKCIVIDVGAPKGDVDQSSVLSKAIFLTPVPGGVGPVTVASLMENAVGIIGES